MEVSQITPLLKPGKPAEEVTSYRPISLLPVLSKLFEKLFLTKINQYYMANVLYQTTSLDSDGNTLLLSKFIGSPM
jgi:hypothetical protein